MKNTTVVVALNEHRILWIKCILACNGREYCILIHWRWREREFYQTERQLGALEMKLKAQIEVQKVWPDAFSKYTGALVPQFQTGRGPATNWAINLWTS